MSPQKELLSGGIYSLVGAMQVIVWVILLPVHTHYLSPSDYGIIAVCNSVAASLSTVFELGLSRASAHMWYGKKESGKSGISELGSILRFQVFTGLCVIVLVGLLGFGDFHFVGIQVYPYIMLSVLAAVMLPIIRVYGEVLRIDGQAGTYACIFTMMTVVNVTLNIVFVVVMGFGAVSVILALVMTNLTGVVFIIFKMWRQLFDPMHWPSVRSALVYGLPLMPHFSIVAFIPTVERGLLTHFAGVQATGIYAVAASFANLITIITTGFSTALRPRLFQLLGRSHQEGYLLRGKILTSMVCGYFIIAVLGSLLAEDAVRLVTGDRFMNAWILIPVLLFRQAIYGAYQIVATAFYFEKRSTGALLFISCIVLFGAIVGNVLLIPQYGVQAVLLVSFAGAIIYFFIAVLLSRFILDVRWPVGGVVGIGMVCAIFSLLAFASLYLTALEVIYTVKIAAFLLPLIFLVVHMRKFQALLKETGRDERFPSS